MPTFSVVRVFKGYRDAQVYACTQFGSCPKLIIERITADWVDARLPIGPALCQWWWRDQCSVPEHLCASEMHLGGEEFGLRMPLIQTEKEFKSLQLVLFSMAALLPVQTWRAASGPRYSILRVPSMPVMESIGTSEAVVASRYGVRLATATATASGAVACFVLMDQPDLAATKATANNIRPLWIFGPVQHATTFESVVTPGCRLVRAHVEMTSSATVCLLLAA